MINNSIKLWRLKLICLFCSIFPPFSFKYFCSIFSRFSVIYVLFIWYVWHKKYSIWCFTWIWLSFECSVCRSWWDQGLLKMFWIQPKSILSSLCIIWPKSINMESFHWKIRQVSLMCHFSLKNGGKHHIFTFWLFSPVLSPLCRRFTTLGFVCNEMSCKL